MNISLEACGAIAAILNVAGTAIKAIPGLPNAYIPFILAIFGSIGYAALEGWTGPNFVIGVGVGLGAVGAHQIVAQTKNIAQKEQNEIK